MVINTKHKFSEINVCIDHKRYISIELMIRQMHQKSVTFVTYGIF